MHTLITEMMLISTERFVGRNYGAQAWGDVVGRLPEPARRIVDRSLSPKRRFEFPVAAEVLDSVVAVCNPDVPAQVLHALGMHNAEDDLGATEKLLMRALTIKLVLRIASMLWTSRVKNGGRMVVESRGRTAAAARIENPPDVADAWWTYLAGWFHRTIELAGGRDVTSSWTGGGSRPGEAASFEVAWR